MEQSYASTLGGLSCSGNGPLATRQRLRRVANGCASGRYGSAVQLLLESALSSEATLRTVPPNLLSASTALSGVILLTIMKSAEVAGLQHLACLTLELLVDRLLAHVAEQGAEAGADGDAEHGDEVAAARTGSPEDIPASRRRVGGRRGMCAPTWQPAVGVADDGGDGVGLDDSGRASASPPSARTAGSRRDARR